ncbi:MAG: peptide-methionine (R)-S-oxide reductase MsrB [Nanoarchaeota archaeon]|nr:peptide-methionine (R)-S-oxide reductase MsrB [Nanoarchaeota archaeon]
MNNKTKINKHVILITKITIIGIVFIMFLIFGLFNMFSTKNSKNELYLEYEIHNITQGEAIELINSTPLNKRKDIPKQIWLKSEILDELSYHVLWRSKTERAFTSELNDEHREGVFVTKGCGIEVFSSEDKFESGTGWPSFTDVINNENIILKEDRSFGMKRVEVLSKCGEHLGHVFDDGPFEKGGKRWCINGAALKFVPKNS